MNIKILTITLLCFMYIACGQNHSHEGRTHDEHAHEEGHHDGHDHEEHLHEDYNHENHDIHDHEEHSCEEHEQDEHNDFIHVTDLNHDNDGANTIEFSKAQSAKINLVVQHPSQKPFGQVIKTVAKIEPAKGKETVLIANTSGIVTMWDNNLLEGKNVSVGQTVLSISSGQLAENNIAVRLAEAESEYESAKENYERDSMLVIDKLISEHELHDSKREFKSAEAIYKNMNKNYSSNGQLIKSNLNGFIKSIFVSNGQYVQEGQALMVISQNKHLLLTAKVQQRYARDLPSIVSANIKSPYNNKIFSLNELNGKVSAYGKAVPDNSHLIPVHLQITNNDDFIPGSLVEVYLKTAGNTGALTIPSSSILEEQGIYYVFVQQNPELFEKREVNIGGTDGIQTEITSGIKADERIVTQGAMHVKLAQASAALDPHSGHVH